MRKKIVFVVFAVATLFGVAGAATPADAGLPVGVKKECGGYNVYIFGSPLIVNVWCPENPPS